jgi:hypothetical protein
MNMNPLQPRDLNASLSSLAMLSLRMQAGKDYLDYLRGFVIDALRQVNGEAIDAARVKELVQSEFGLNIPAATFSIYLKRLVKEGIIAATGDGVQYHVKLLPDTTVTADRKAASAQISEVTEELAAFAYQKYSLQWDDIISSGALADFVRQYSIDFLKFAELKSPLPGSASGQESTSYVVAAFITNTAREKPGLFQSIKVLVQSHILSNALMCPDLEKANRGFKGVHFLVDTRFMIKALDLESQYDTENARALLAAIRTLKGIICIFPDTKHELCTVLKAIIRGMQNSAGRGPVYRELLKRRRGVADVILAERNLDASLASLSISVLPNPSYGEHTYAFQIDEAELRDEIDTQIDYISDKAAEHDIHVVRHIFALRKGRSVSSIEDSGYVFLTTNSALSRAAFQYERKNSKGWIFSAVVTDYHLSHLAWLKSPMEVPDLPRVEILANCYAIMRPDESIWNRYLSEVARLKSENKVSEKDHEVLRFSLNAPDELMDVTRGEVEGITAANLHIILQKLERTYAVEKEQKLEQARLAHEETKKSLAELELTAQKIGREQDAALAREKNLEQEKASQEEELWRLKEIASQAKLGEEKRAGRISRIANAIAKAAFIVTGLVFAAIAILAVFSSINGWFGVPAAIVGFFNLWCGFSGNSVEQAVKRRVATWLARFMN